MKNSEELFQKTADAGAMLATAATDIVAKNGGGRCEAAYAAMGAVIGAAQVFSLMLTKNLSKEEESASEESILADRLTDDSFLFGCLMVAAAVRFNKVSGTLAASDVEMSPAVYLDAMNAFEKLTGKRPDSFLSEGMVRAAREAEHSANSMLAAIMPANNKPA